MGQFARAMLFCGALAMLPIAGSSYMAIKDAGVKAAKMETAGASFSVGSYRGGGRYWAGRGYRYGRHHRGYYRPYYRPYYNNYYYGYPYGGGFVVVV